MATGQRLEAGKLLSTIYRFNTQDCPDGVVDRTSVEFLSDVSHELRTPLSSLITSIELLTSGYRQMPEQQFEHLLSVTHRSIVKLENLVENLLSASSIQLGCFSIKPQPSDLVEIIDEAIAFVEPLLQKKGQSLEKQMSDALPLVMADPLRITQVIINLLSNANKYGPANDGIKLKVRRHSRHVIVSVSENGPGIAPEEQRTIFDRFYRSRRSETEGVRGVGLGLALIKTIVTSHGGKVGVNSKPGRGSSFWFTLPIIETSTMRGDGR